MRPEVDEINVMARALHGSDVRASAYTLKSLREHVDEVEELLSAGDDHWKAEVMDIIIHGQTLLRRGCVSDAFYQKLLAQRLKRFKEKISQRKG